MGLGHGEVRLESLGPLCSLRDEGAQAAGACFLARAGRRRVLIPVSELPFPAV